MQAVEKKKASYIHKDGKQENLKSKEKGGVVLLAASHLDQRVHLLLAEPLWVVHVGQAVLKPPRRVVHR